MKNLWAARGQNDPCRATSDTGSRPLGASSWKDFRVPGQWRQQGFDIPQDRTVAVAREFEVPRQWADRRIFLRFDAIHAGVEYRLNGQRIFPDRCWHTQARDISCWKGLNLVNWLRK